MKTALFDCFSGISGDMAVGALIDAGADIEAIRAAVHTLDLPPFGIRAEKVGKKGVRATQFRVLDPESGHAHDAVHGHHHADRGGHEHGDHDHEHHHHDHEHGHTHGHEHGHTHGHEHHHDHGHSHSHDHHRHLSDIYKIISKGMLPPAVRDAASETFRRIGEAEAEVHGIPVDRIHFHEVGLVDSIVDIVAAQMAWHLLGIQQAFSTPLHVGTGTFRCAHGVMPVPAPATALLLQGVPQYGGAVNGELVTPTGAALITSWVRDWSSAPILRVEAVGHGSGTKDLADRANILRVQIGEAAGTSESRQTITVLEAHIDDMNGELLAPLVDALLAAGARDAYLTPVIGKKGRPAFGVTALCDADKADAVAQALFANSTTLGLRQRVEERRVLERKITHVSTPWGTVHVKVSSIAGARNTAAPEFEDCRRLAAAASVPVRQVYDAALAAALKGEFK